MHIIGELTAHLSLFVIAFEFSGIFWLICVFMGGQSQIMEHPLLHDALSGGQGTDSTHIHAVLYIRPKPKGWYLKLLCQHYKDLASTPHTTSLIKGRWEGKNMLYIDTVT